jgi:hypothetical protein
VPIVNDPFAFPDPKMTPGLTSPPSAPAAESAKTPVTIRVFMFVPLVSSSSIAERDPITWHLITYKSGNISYSIDLKIRENSQRSQNFPIEDYPS